MHVLTTYSKDNLWIKIEVTTRKIAMAHAFRPTLRRQREVGPEQSEFQSSLLYELQASQGYIV